MSFTNIWDDIWDTANHALRTSSSTAASTSSSVTSVNDTNASTTLIAANTSRKELLIYNASTATLYVKLGTTASTSDYTVALVSETTPGTGGFLRTTHQGRVDGIWSADASGAAKITELS